MIQNQYPLWRYLVVVAVLIVGALYALPNLYGFDPALQVTARRSAPVDEALEARLEKALGGAGVAPKSVETGDDRLLFRFASDEIGRAHV